LIENQVDTNPHTITLTSHLQIALGLPQSNTFVTSLTTNNVNIRPIQTLYLHSNAVYDTKNNVQASDGDCSDIIQIYDIEKGGLQHYDMFDNMKKFNTTYDIIFSFSDFDNDEQRLNNSVFTITFALLKYIDSYYELLQKEQKLNLMVLKD